jgi:NADH dehydrogenase
VSAHRVVVVGAGFGGLSVARHLGDQPDIDVLVVDRANYHLFQPLLYQVATAGLEPADIAHPARAILRRHRNVRFRSGEVTGVDWDTRRLLVKGSAPIPFDSLVLAAGARTATFGVPGVLEHAFGLKRLQDAVALRSHLLRQFEQADADPTQVDLGALNVVVVGGGPTGVEMAGAFTELFHVVFARDFPRLPIHRARVVLVEMADELLIPFVRPLRNAARRELYHKGVELELGRSVAEVDAKGVRLDDGRLIPARTVLWAAGVQAEPLGAAPTSPSRTTSGCGRSATSPRPPTRRARSSPSSRRWRSRAAPTSPSASWPATRASSPGRSTTSTAGRWRPSAAGRRWRSCPGGSASPARWRGWPGWACT